MDAGYRSLLAFWLGGAGIATEPSPESAPPPSGAATHSTTHQYPRGAWLLPLEELEDEELIILLAMAD